MMTCATLHDLVPFTILLLSRFIGEESVAAGEKCDFTDEPTWIIDPVDGTMNFVHSFPHSCISLAVTYKKEVQIGIIYNPMLDQLFTAKLSQGAFLNGKPIHVSGETGSGWIISYCMLSL